MARAINLCLAVVLGVVLAWLAVELKTVYAMLKQQLSISSIAFSAIYLLAVIFLWRVCTLAYHQLFRSKVWVSTLCLSTPLILTELVLFTQGSSLVHIATTIAVIAMAVHISLKSKKELHL